MIILNIMPMLGPTPQPGSQDTSANTSLASNYFSLSGVASALYYFFCGTSSPGSETSSTTPTPRTGAARTGTGLRREARTFLGSMRPFIVQGRLLDLAEELRTVIKSGETQHDGVSAKGNTTIKVQHKLAEKLLKQMPEWLRTHDYHLSDEALTYASTWAPYLKGAAAGSPLACQVTRFGAVASLIDAYMIDEFPSGIGVVTTAFQLDIPAVLATRHHTRGGWGVPAIAEFLRERGLLNGLVSSYYPSTYCPNEHADIFWEASKDSVDIWTHSFTRLLEKGLKPDASIVMVVDDNLSESIREAIKRAFRDTVAQAYEDKNPGVTKKYKLALCTSPELAQAALKSGKIAGVVSDLFSPRIQTKKARDEFRALFEQVCQCIGIPPAANMQALLDTLDSEKRQALGQVTREFNKISQSLKRARNSPTLPTAGSPSEEAPQS